MNAAFTHIPVLRQEVMAALAPIEDQIFIDGTFGAGGYSRALLDAGARQVIAIDRDPSAIAAGEPLRRESRGRLTLVEGPFGALDRHAQEAGITKADGVVLDVGVSSMQLDTPERGFSFRADGPLDMRMSGKGLSAAEVVNDFEASTLTAILRFFGEERHAGRLARAIAERRLERPFTRTGDLSALCEKVLGPQRFGSIHPATRTFQALRIFVNDELRELANALAASERILRSGGRLAVVTFHSLEDRIVKQFLAMRSRTHSQGSRHAPEESLMPPTFTDLAKPISPSDAEIAANPRSRSAKLRQAKRTAAAARALDPALLAHTTFMPTHGRD